MPCGYNGHSAILNQFDTNTEEKREKCLPSAESFLQKKIDFFVYMVSSPFFFPPKSVLPTFYGAVHTLWVPCRIRRVPRSTVGSGQSSRDPKEGVVQGGLGIHCAHCILVIIPLEDKGGIGGINQGPHFLYFPQNLWSGHAKHRS
jgi:hypothetical protein